MSFGRWRVEELSFHCFVQWSHWNTFSVPPTPVISMSRIVADRQKGQMPMVFTCLLPEYMILDHDFAHGDVRIALGLFRRGDVFGRRCLPSILANRFCVT